MRAGLSHTSFPSVSQNLCCFQDCLDIWQMASECVGLPSLVTQPIKNLPANAGDLGSIHGGREGNGSPLQYSCLENLHGQNE